MAIPWQDLFEELAANASATWPETRRAPDAEGGGIWEWNEVERTNQGRIGAFPYSVFETLAVNSADWGLVNSAFEAELAFWYVDRLPAGASNTTGLTRLRERLDAFRARLLHPGNVTLATVLDVTALDWGAGNPALEMLHQKNLAYVAGGVHVTLVVGETIG